MEYNTERPFLILREYGRNVQKLIAFALKENNKEKQQDIVNHIIHIMGNLNPHLRNVEDFTHLLWDHLHIMSNFQLDVDSPYPKPDKEVLEAKPDSFPYPQKNTRHKHYGKNILTMIDKAIEMKDEDEKAAYAEYIANYMKLVHTNWNSENVSDETILNDLQVLSKNKLSLGNETTLNKVKTKRPVSNRNTNKRYPSKRKNYSYSKNRN